MPTEFEDALSEITGANAATAPQQEQTQSPQAPAESNAFEQALAEMPAPSPERDAPEPGGGLER